MIDDLTGKLAVLCGFLLAAAMIGFFILAVNAAVYIGGGCRAV